MLRAFMQEASCLRVRCARRRQLSRQPGTEDMRSLFACPPVATAAAHNARSMAAQPAAADVAGEDEAAPPATTIASLSRALLARVLARVPVDTRLRCCEVSAGWNDFLASELSLWTALDLSDTSGVTHKVTNALLRAAAAKAGGALTALNVPSFGVGSCTRTCWQ
jgi:hypothetical protein